jgi:hypothetical protein
MEDEIRLDGYIASIWRGKWFILVAVALAGFVTAYLTWGRPTYSSSALVQVGKVWKEPLEDLSTTSEVINSDGFLADLASKLGTPADRLKAAVHAETIVSAGPLRTSYPILVRVSAAAQTPEESARLVTAVTDEVVARHHVLYDRAIAPHLEHQRQLESAIGADGRTADETIKLLASLDEVKSNNASPSVTQETHLIEAVTPGPVTKPAILRPTITACLLTAVIAASVAAAVGRRSRSLARHGAF